MKAAWINQYGGPEVILTTSFTKLIRKPGEVLVRMIASTLNHHDIYLRRGEAGKIILPVILGSDGAGEVVESDLTSRFSSGDRVAIYPVLNCGKCCSCVANLPHKCQNFGIIGGESNGTHAEYVVVPEKCLIAMPDNLDFETAATISLAGLTAWNMVVDEGKAKKGEHALILGASGGVGTFSLLLLKRLGLYVHVVTSNPNKKESLLALGADTVLDDSLTSVLKYTRTLPNRGVDIAFNCVGGNTWRYVPMTVRSGGRIMVCGTIRTPIAEIDMRQIFYRNLSLLGCSMGTPKALHSLLMIAAAESNFRTRIDQIISINEIPDAHRRMESGLITGKILIRNSELSC